MSRTLADLIETHDVKIQRIDIEKPNGTAAGSFTTKFQADSGYEVFAGFIATEVKDGGINSNYRIGLSSQNGTIIAPINVKAWTRDNQAEKTFFIPVDSTGKNMIITTETGAALTSDLAFEIAVIQIRAKSC